MEAYLFIAGVLMGIAIMRWHMIRKPFKKPLTCSIGFHNWYYGSYATPVWGRSERRCMDCKKTQYRDHKKRKYITY